MKPTSTTVLCHLMLACAILLFGFAVMLATGHATPLFEAPDEGAHFLYADTIASTRDFPIIESREEVLTSRSHERHQLPLYYLIGALLIADTDRSEIEASIRGNPFTVQGQIAVNNANTFIQRLEPLDQTAQASWRYRLFGVMLALVNTCGVYRAARIITRRRALAALSMLALLSVPSFLFIASAINNDNLAALLGTFGFWWLLRAWTRRRITLTDALIFALIAAGAMLTKLNIALLTPFAFGWLLIGVWQRRIAHREWLRAAVITACAMLILSGWWYIRSWVLYGDPLGVEATSGVWGRGAPPTDIGRILFEAEGVWRSFWMVLGNFNTPGPDWLIVLVTLATGAMPIGLTIRAGRKRITTPEVMAATWCLVVVAALVAVTRTINASQGRFLFPIMAALLPLMIMGLHRLWRGAPSILIGGLAVAALIMPTVVLPRAFPIAQPVATIPTDAVTVDASADGVSLLAYHIITPTVTPRDIVVVDVYLSGTGGADLALLAKAIDPATDVPIASIDTPPGLVSADQFTPGVIYRVRLRLRIEEARITGFEDRQLVFAFGWWRGLNGDPFDQSRVVPFVSASGAAFDVLRVPGSWLDQQR